MNTAGSADVIVVGAGPSGLAAAHRLSQSGASVRVLDAAERVGGKMSTVHRDGYIVDNGAFFLTSNYHNVLSIADEIGMGDEVVAGRLVLGVARDGVLHDLDGDHLVSSIVNTRLLSLRAKAELIKLIPELVRSRKADYQHISSLGRCDDETVSQWAASHLSPELQEFLIGALMRGISATSGDSTSHVDLLALLRLLGGAKIRGFRDGMSSYAERIAADMKVECGAAVTAVESDDTGVTVHWADTTGNQRQERADACVVATPGVITAEIVAQLDDWRKGFLSRVHNNPLIVVNVGLCRRPAFDSTYILVPASVHPFITGVMLDHHKAPGRAPDGRGLLTVALLDTWCRDHWDDDDDAICRAVLNGLDMIIPGIRDSVEFAQATRWQLEVNPIGFYRELGRFREICERDTRIQLAGDSQSMQNIEAATTTGLRAADRLLSTGILRGA